MRLSSERGDETETREEAYGDPIPQNVNFLDQKSKVKPHPKACQVKSKVKSHPKKAIRHTEINFLVDISNNC